MRKMLLVFLLLCSDTLHAEFSQQNPRLQDETGMLAESFSVETMHRKSNHTDDSQFVKCLICKLLVNANIKRIRRRIEQKIAKFCRGFVPQFRSACFSQCRKVGGYLMKEIFPGGGKGTCFLMAIC